MIIIICSIKQCLWIVVWLYITCCYIQSTQNRLWTTRLAVFLTSLASYYILKFYITPPPSEILAHEPLSTLEIQICDTAPPPPTSPFKIQTYNPLPLNSIWIYNLQWRNWYFVELPNRVSGSSKYSRPVWAHTYRSKNSFNINTCNHSSGWTMEIFETKLTSFILN